MRAWVKTERLTGLNLTVTDIINAIQSQNIQAAVGRIGARPIFNDQQLQLNIQTKGRLSSVADFENIVIRTNPDGSVLRLRDVAKLELGAANLDRDTRFNGEDAAAIVDLPVAGRQCDRHRRTPCAKKLSELEKRFPEDLAWKITYDPTIFVTDTMHEVKKTLFEAFVLVVLVVFLFLGNVRATLIPTLAVPVSLIGTFIALKAVGYSANTVSLLAIVLAIGIVVDDAIVVVENVERVMEENPELSPAEASKRAMAEITAPIIAITLVLLSVFVPIAFIPGISGELFRQFAVTVAVAMLLSAINALTLSPALCAVLLSPHHGPRRGIIGWLMRSIDWVRDQYGAVVARMVRFSIIGLAMVVVAGAGTVGLARVTPTGFVPEDDQGAIFVVVQLPGGASVGRTSEVMRQAEAMVKEDPAVAEYTSIIGLNFIDNYSQPNAGFMVVTFKPFEERKERRARRPRGDRAAADEIPSDPGRHRRAAGAAADRRSRHRRRIYLCARGSARRRSKGTGPGSARGYRGGQPGSATARRVQHVLGDQPVDLSRYRPRQGAGPRRAAQGRVPGAAGVARRLFHQQPEPVRPHLAGAGPGRGRRQVEYRRHLSHQCAQCRGQDDPAAQPRGGAHRRRSAGVDPLQ